MGLLVGLPLKIFHILFVIVRLSWPVLLAWVVWRLIVRRRRKEQPPKEVKKEESGPTFRGPVYTVDYQEVDEDKKG